MKEIKTNNGKKGGWLVGKRHYDKNGKPLGGIKAIVTDVGGKPVELEGGEVIINREASKKHWKELSRINQSAGNGVAIGPPAGLDEDPEEYKEGGRVIEFNPNHIPNKWILSYAEKIKAKHPEIWKLGGNIFGNEAFNNLKRVADRGHWLDSEEWMYIKWRSYVARHQRDYRIEGVVAMLKWVDKVEKGWPYMKQLIEEKIDKLSKKGWKHKAAKMKDGGDIENKKISKVKTIIYTEKDYEQNIKLYQNIIDKKRNNWEQAQNEYDLIISRVPFTTWYLDLKKGENKFEFLENTYEVFSETKKIVGTSYTQRNFSETKWGIKPIEIKNEDTHLKKFKITTGSSAYFKTKELLITNVNEHFKDLILRKVIDVQMPKSIMKDGGSVAQTPAPKKDRIFGSDVNKQKSSSSAKSGSSIKFSKELTYTISDKVKEHNSNNPSKKVTLSVAKAVVRRGMGAYSSSHRPTITGGKPNDRTAWGLARLNAFFYKIEHGKSKSGKYTQDDDLIEDLEISVRKLKNGGSLGKYAFVESITTTGKKVFKLFDHVPTNKEVFEYFKTTKDEKGNPVIIEDSTIRIETFSGFDRDSFLEQVNKVALKQFGSEIDDMDELMFSFDRYSLNVFPFEAELENDMDVVISVVDGVIFIEPTRKMKDGGNIEYQSRDLNGTMVYYKRKDGSKWDFISKDEFDQNANEMNTVTFEDSSMSTNERNIEGKQKSYILPESALQITNFLKKQGFEVSQSYGRNAGSTYVRSSKGFNVKKNKRMNYNGAKHMTFVVESNQDETLENIRKILLENNYSALKPKFGRMVVLGYKLEYKDGGNINTALNRLKELPKGSLFEDAKRIDGIFKKSNHSWSEVIETFEKNKDKGKSQIIDLKEINITQPNIQSHKIEGMLENFDKLPVINVIEFNDGLVIYDGHHRLTTAWLLGKSKIKANVVKASNSEKMKTGGLIPPMGTLTTKDKKTKLDYKKVGNDFEFVVYDSEPNPIHKVFMNHDQFINYLYDEGYIDDKMKDGGELVMGIKAEHEHSKTISKFKKPGVSDLDIETAIAKDHLKEDSHYYSKLAKMEGKKYAQGGVLQIGSTGILKGRTNKDVQIISISDKIVTYLDVESGKKTGLYKDKFIEKFIDKGTIETDIDVETKVQKISKPIQKIPTKEAFKIDADYVSLFEINLDKTSEMMKKVTDDQLIDNQLFSFNKIVESMGLKS